MGIIKDRAKLAAGVTVVVLSTAKRAVGKRTEAKGRGAASMTMTVLLSPSFVIHS